MRFTKIAVAALLSLMAVLGGGATALADTTPAATYEVKAWHDVKVRSCPATACSQQGMMSAGDTSNAYCWMHGEPVTDFGITRDIWVLVGHQDGGNQFVNALYLEGDFKGNLPSNLYCKIHG